MVMSANPSWLWETVRSPTSNFWHVQLFISNSPLYTSSMGSVQFSVFLSTCTGRQLQREPTRSRSQCKHRTRIACLRMGCVPVQLARGMAAAIPWQRFCHL